MAANTSSSDPLRTTAKSSVSPPPPPIDLKHMTSTGVLTSPTKDHRSTNRLSQHLRAADPRVGSPTSIPSSPTSIRSSSSAIFERDIEPLVSPSPPSANAHHHPTNPHRIPRAKGSEQLELSVPSVLDSAAAILADIEPEDLASEVAVTSPANSIFESMVGRSSGFASPIGSFRSRSPSPSRVGQATAGRGDVLLSIPVSSQASQAISSPASILGLQNVASPTFSPPPSASLSPAPHQPRPTIHTTQTVQPIPSVSSNVSTSMPALVTPTSSYFSGGSETLPNESSPTTTTLEHPPQNAITSPVVLPSFQKASSMQSGSPPASSTPATSQSQFSSPSSAPISLSSHPPSPHHVPKKRLSFMSYNDLLTSTPATTQPLATLTTLASSSEPPPHIPSVSGLNIASALHASSSGSVSGGSRAPSVRGFSLGSVGVGPSGGLSHPGKRDSIALLDNVGGEWEREGLGLGLEERLDALVVSPPAVPVGGKV